MQKQNQSSKLIFGLLAMTLLFSVVTTVLLNHAYGDGSYYKQKQTLENKVKNDTQSALKETRQDAQQTAIKTREQTALHEKAVKADKEKQLVQEPKVAALILKQQDEQRAKFEAKQSPISKTGMQKKEIATDSARLNAVTKQSYASELKVQQLKGYTQTALKETRKYQQDTTVNTRNSNIIKHIDWKNSIPKKIKNTVFLPLQHNNPNLLILASMHNNVSNINHKT